MLPVPVRIFQNQSLSQFAKKNHLSAAAVCKAASEVCAGLIHANLGGGVYKQRIARPGQGKSGGFRSIVFFREHERIFFVLGFSKNARDNIDGQELSALKEFAKEFFSYDEAKINVLLQRGALIEVSCEHPI